MILTTQDRLLIQTFLDATAGTEAHSTHGPLDLERLVRMLLEDVALMVRRPGSWEGSNMFRVMASHGYADAHTAALSQLVQVAPGVPMFNLQPGAIATEPAPTQDAVAEVLAQVPSAPETPASRVNEAAALEQHTDPAPLNSRVAAQLAARSAMDNARDTLRERIGPDAGYALRRAALLAEQGRADELYASLAAISLTVLIDLQDQHDNDAIDENSRERCPEWLPVYVPQGSALRTMIADALERDGVRTPAEKCALTIADAADMGAVLYGLFPKH